MLLPWFAVACLLVWLVAERRPWDRENRKQVATLSTILKLTGPNEFVMDPKSGAIFRNRPFYFALETVTRARMRHELIRDEIAQRLIETKTTVADNRGYQHGTKGETFIFANYVPLAENDAIGIAGKCISPTPVLAGGNIRFQVSIAACYSVVDEHGRVAGVLDGKGFDQSRDLAPGQHTFSPSRPCSHLTLVLAKAVDLGHMPRLPEGDTSRSRATKEWRRS